MNRCIPALVYIAFFCSWCTAWGLPSIGDRAPVIRVSHILTNPHPSLSPAALVGKTVVIDFWATWCGPCIASMPHMNELEASVDPKKFVFVALDDEPEAVVTKFMAKRDIASIVALDGDGSTFKAFGVDERPRAIVIDPMGKVALVTQPKDLTLKQLLAISIAKRASATFNQATKNSGLSTPPVTHVEEPLNTVPEASETLAGASVRKKLLTERAYMFEHDSEGRQTYIGRDAKSLVSIALGKSERHIRFLSDLPPGSYDLELNLGNVDDRTQQCILTAIVAKAFDLDIKKTDVTEDALVLKQSADTVLKMQPTFDMASPSSVQQSGTQASFSNLSAQAIADIIEGRYGVTVVEDTALSGHFDGVIHWPETKEGLDDALRHDLGLEVTVKRQPIPLYVVSKHVH